VRTSRDDSHDHSRPHRSSDLRSFRGAFERGHEAFHGHGHHGRGPRGMMRALLLEALAVGPTYGYQIMRHLEDRSGGMWRPSAGSVYPTLQQLEDEGLIEGEESEGRRIYSLTEKGKAAGTAGKASPAESPWAWFAEQAKAPPAQLGHALAQLGDAGRAVASTGSPEQVEKALKVLGDARRRLYQMLAEEQ